MQISQIIIGGFGIHTEGQYESNGTIPARLPLLVEGTEAAEAGHELTTFSSLDKSCEIDSNRKVQSLRAGAGAEAEEDEIPPASFDFTDDLGAE
jgi:hypothetical protein